jgi:hypothetical protein
MRCDQEDCPFWDGDGCPCRVLDISEEAREQAERDLEAY